ncbi:MAG: hypothetical protein ACP5P3_02805 [Ignavibacteria bacterium]
MKKFFVVLSVFVLSSGIVFSQTINTRLSSYFYTWSRLDSISSSNSTTHIRGYQNLLIDVNVKQWTLNTLLQTEEDVIKKIGRGFGYRFYSLYLKGSNLFNVLDLKLGRQYLSAGTGRGTIDGLYFKLKLGQNKEYQVVGYGGELTPLSYEIEKYPSLKDNYTFGGQFIYYGIRDLMLSLSYTNKHRKPISYYALRLDSLFNTREVLVETDSPADQLAGFDFNYALFGKHNIYGRAYYDINTNRFLKGELNVGAVITDRIRASAGYIYREPQISYNSLFWVFTHKQSQEVELGVDYTFPNNINIFGRLSEVIYQNDNSAKLVIGFNHPSFGFSFSKYFKYAGEADGFYGYLSQEVIKSKLSVNGSINYSRYALGEYATEKQTVFGGTLGITYRPLPSISIDAQGQIVTNPDYDYDSRFLVGFSYWLFSRF